MPAVPSTPLVRAAALAGLVAATAAATLALPADAAPTETTEHLVFETTRDGDFEVYATDGGGDPVNLTDHPAHDSAPVWSPDGSRIAFVSDRDGVSDLFVMDADGDNVRNVTTSDAHELTPAWHPDGTEVAVTVHTPATDSTPAETDVVVLSVDAPAKPEILTEPGSADAFPTWSPDGSELAFASNRDGAWLELYRIDRGTRAITRLTNDPADAQAHDAMPAWSPDGDTIVFTSNRTGTADLHLLDLGSGAITRATTHSGGDLWPSWSPTGDEILFQRTGGFEAAVAAAGLYFHAAATGGTSADVKSLRLDGAEAGESDVVTDAGHDGHPGLAHECTGHAWSDIGAWLEDAADWAACAGHLDGYADGTFKANRDITRGQAARLLFRVEDPDVDGLGPASWTDVPAWLADAAAWLEANDLMDGYTDGTFRADEPITRNQLVRLLWRLAGEPAASSGHGLGDVAPWVDDAVAWAVEQGVMTGYADGTFRGGDPVTRGQTLRSTCRAFGPC